MTSRTQTTHIRVLIIDKAWHEAYMRLHGLTSAEAYHRIVERIQAQEAAAGHEIAILPKLAEDMQR